jgi:epoxyqueuosine reductase
LRLARKYALQIKAEAKRLGFQACGISKAGFLEEEAPRLESYLKNGYQGKMQYLENHFDKRLDPVKLVEGAKSVISLTYNYYSELKQTDGDAPRISMYAYGKDYHDVIREKLYALLAFIQEEIGEVHGRVFVDSAPVLDRAWAKRSGLGWIGKNGMLIAHKQGSWFFLAELIVDLELEEDKPIGDYCGNCTRCMDACPTQAIVSPKVIDGSKCISYFTIELKDSIPSEMKGKLDQWAFGCDVCQSVCPWNRFSIAHQTPAFQPKSRLLDMTRREWHDLTIDAFNDLFKGSAVKRAGYSKLKDTIHFLQTDLSQD